MLFQAKPHVFLEHPQPHVLLVRAPIAPWIRTVVPLFCSLVTALMLFANVSLGPLGRMVVIALMLAVMALVLTSHGYQTLFDLQRMLVEHRYGLFGSTQAKVLPITAELVISVAPSGGVVALKLGNAWPRPLYNFTMSYRGSQHSRSTPVRISRLVFDTAAQIVAWLNQHGVAARLECSSGRPYELL